MHMSDTPRTDALHDELLADQSADDRGRFTRMKWHARGLERELAQRCVCKFEDGILVSSCEEHRALASHSPEVRSIIAELREKNGKRSCDCTSCDCSNSGDTYSVGSWDGAEWVLAELEKRLLPQSGTSK